MPSRALRSWVQGLPRTYWYLWTAMLINRLGGFLFTFVLAVYFYSMYAVKQEKFLDDFKMPNQPTN